jgi:hypothetical protein
MFSSNGQTVVTLFPITGPDDQSGRVQDLERASCAKSSGFAVFGIQGVKSKKSALAWRGC